MEIEINKITEGEMNNKEAWVCDLRYNDFNKKPIRHIKPTKVLIRSNEFTKKTIYYSESHFVALNKKGEPTTKVIGVYDTTGYRSFRGTALACYDTKKECIKHYDIQVTDAVTGLKEYKKQIVKEIDIKILGLL